MLGLSFPGQSLCLYFCFLDPLLIRFCCLLFFFSFFIFYSHGLISSIVISVRASDTVYGVGHDYSRLWVTAATSAEDPASQWHQQPQGSAEQLERDRASPGRPSASASLDFWCVWPQGPAQSVECLPGLCPVGTPAPACLAAAPLSTWSPRKDGSTCGEAA